MQKVFIYDPTSSDKLSSVRGIGRYLQILKENFANEFEFVNNETMKQLNNGKILIVFWPQYLEFVGFGLMIVSLIFVLLHQPKIKVDEKNN